MKDARMKGAAMGERTMIEQNSSHMSGPGALVAEDAALRLYQIAALMLGNEDQAVALVEETVAQVETDPCDQGTLAYAEAQSLLTQIAVGRMAGLHPAAFAVPVAPAAPAGCIDTSNLSEEGEDSTLTSEQFGSLLAGPGRAGMREWLNSLSYDLRAIFVLRAVAGLDSEQTAQSLRQCGAAGAEGWRRDAVATAYRQALCSLATSMMNARGSLLPA